MSEFKHIVRLAGTDLDGNKKLVPALTKIRGVGIPLAEAVVKVTGLDPSKQTGFLTEGEIKKITDALKEPIKYGIPNWLVNRPKAFETGKPAHLTGPDLILRVKSDIDFMQKMRSWKGIRHSLGLKVRGQRTKTTGRFGKAVGVRKALVIAAARAKTAGAPEAAPTAPTAATAPTGPTPAAAPKKEEAKEKKEETKEKKEEPKEKKA